MKTRVLALALAAVALLVAGAPWLAQGEVTKKPAQETPPAEAQIEPRPVHAGVPIRVQCWQDGVKIIDQAGLSGLSINAVTRQRSVSFKRSGDGQPTVFVLPFDESLCLIQPER